MTSLNACVKQKQRVLDALDDLLQGRLQGVKTINNANGLKPYLTAAKAVGADKAAAAIERLIHGECLVICFCPFVRLMSVTTAFTERQRMHTSDGNDDDNVGKSDDDHWDHDVVEKPNDSDDDGSDDGSDDNSDDLEPTNKEILVTSKESAAVNRLTLRF